MPLKKTVNDQSCSTLDKTGSQSVKIDKNRNEFKRTTARTDQTTRKGLSIRYFDWPIPVFIRFIRTTLEFTEYICCKIIIVDLKKT